MIPGTREKAALTCLEKYGVRCFLQTEEAMEKAREGFIAHLHEGLSRISNINKETAKYIEYQFNVKSEFEHLVVGKFYDLILEGTNILIEVDPTYTHSDLPNHWSAKGLDPQYHIQKTLTAEKAGYRCIHIFDWDDLDKIGMMIQPKTKIYARRCEVKNISVNDANEFIDRYHIQGKAKGVIKSYGLFYDSQLVSVMTFGKPRYNRRYEWELLRLCTLPDRIVIGGPNKMMHKFINEVNPSSIISYCDRAKFKGDVYFKLGFKLDHVSSPAKVWSKGDKHVTDNLLRQRGFDQLFGTNYGKGTSNEELMIKDGWRSVYDCGQMVFEWLRSN